jgi:hypothetical protein
MLRGEALELADHLDVPPQGELGIDQVLERGEPKLLQAPDVFLQEGLEAEVGQRPPPPEGERDAKGAGGALGIALPRQGPRFGHPALESIEVELSILEAQLIAGGSGGEDVTAAAGTQRLEQGLSASERRDLLSLLHHALDAASPESPWRAEEGD